MDICFVLDEAIRGYRDWMGKNPWGLRISKPMLALISETLQIQQRWIDEQEFDGIVFPTYRGIAVVVVEGGETILGLIPEKSQHIPRLYRDRK